MMPLSDVFKQNILKKFDYLKKISDAHALENAVIPTLSGSGQLLPVCAFYLRQFEIVKLLAKWRAENQSAYPTRFRVTEDGTARWLEALVHQSPGRILFFVRDRSHRLVGHLGYNSCVNDDRSMEIDNVVRGVSGIEKGLMGDALNTIVDWAKQYFCPSRIYLRVLHDNQHAIQFYERNGFEKSEMIPLRKHSDQNSETFKPMGSDDGSEPDSYFLKMSLKG